MTAHQEAGTATPRVDAACFHHECDKGAQWIVFAEFARQLESELDAYKHSGERKDRAIEQLMKELGEAETDLTAAREALEAKERECMAWEADDKGYAGMWKVANHAACEAEERAATAEAALAGVREQCAKVNRELQEASNRIYTLEAAAREFIEAHEDWQHTTEFLGIDDDPLTDAYKMAKVVMAEGALPDDGRSREWLRQNTEDAEIGQQLRNMMLLTGELDNPPSDPLQHVVALRDALIMARRELTEVRSKWVKAWASQEHPAHEMFIVCEICLNKRCPHALDQRNPCTNSNAGKS